jgi:hypothetical protein
MQAVQQEIKSLEVKSFMDILNKGLPYETASYERIEPRWDGKTLTIEVKRMYEYVTITTMMLMEMVQWFGTMGIDVVDKYSYPGCETCDYGSSYTVTLIVQNPSKNVEHTLEEIKKWAESGV